MRRIVSIAVVGLLAALFVCSIAGCSHPDPLETAAPPPGPNARPGVAINKMKLPPPPAGMGTPGKK